MFVHTAIAQVSLTVDNALHLTRLTPSVLHVAAMPFPTRQGTQGAVAAMVRAHRSLGAAVDLVTYRHRDRSLDDDLAPHRVHGAIRDQSLRSGPSLRKVAQDVYLARWLRKNGGRYQRIFAHHVEAAGACLAAGVPFSFIAHTHLQSEITDYVPTVLAGAATQAAVFLEAVIVARAERVYAVSPHLVRAFSSERPDARLLPIPITAMPGMDKPLRSILELPTNVLVAAYRGNLDRYQGIPQMLSSVGALQPRVHLALATGSRASIQARSWLSVHALDRLDGREDLALCPRRSFGGIAMKLLDSIQRGVPVFATPEAVSGFDVPGVVIAPFSQWASSLHAYLEGTVSADIQQARSWLARTHSPAAFAAALAYSA